MDDLLEEILIEQEYIERTLRLLDEAFNRPDKSAIELSAIGSFLHHCYTGMENILNRILKFKKVKIQSSASSHRDLLNIAVDENVISQDLSDKLDRYRGFRHFFVHAYGILLDEDELNPLAISLADVWEQFHNEIEECIKILSPK